MAKNIVLGITGGIAASKTPDLVSRLRKAGYNVWVILTENGAEFVTPLTLETISNNPVVTDMFDRDTPWEVEHISLAKRADMFLVAPATANILAKINHGIADDMLSTTIMATEAPIFIAPAMNTVMYNNTATQANIDSLINRGVSFIGPDSGLLACGDYGPGRMTEPSEIVKAINNYFELSKDYKGKKVLITAGPTREYIDPVRFITNPSTGKMGYAIAKSARDRGADVTIISGPVNLPKPKNIDVIDIESSGEMYEAVVSIYEDYDIIIKAAAPADYSPSEKRSKKIKKGDDSLNIELDRTKDIAKSIGNNKGDAILAIFAAETNDLVKNARKKLLSKNADMIIANDVTQKGAGFASNTNIVTIITDNKETEYQMMEKSKLADIILDEIKLISDTKAE